MPDIRYIPISRLGAPRLRDLSLLMQEEQEAWLGELGWDYSIIQQILLSFIDKKMLPGYAAFVGDAAGAGWKMAGYIYFLISSSPGQPQARSKGNIGALYTTGTIPAKDAQEVADGLLDLAVASFRDSSAVRRVEAQILPFRRQSFAGVFARNGFRRYPRLYMTLRLGDGAGGGRAVERRGTPSATIVPFDTARLKGAAKMTVESYRGELDADICEDYLTAEACENYLRSLVGNPGCGVFLPDASFMALDEGGGPCGYAICSRIAEGSALLPQIAVRPDCKGTGVGDALMGRCLGKLRAWGFGALSLTVSDKNSRACGWYRRLGFLPRKEFGAFVWNRP
ncbi:MAG: GNAT family N-acetyltransferase [Acidobacteriota bacterium]|jgi:GNAT superfamily N-acetyltransferase|nr:GNAT family N-acetyltransferase [Acidobacteriota bacterium]